MSLEVAIQNLADAINNLANASGQTKLPFDPAKAKAADDEIKAILRASSEQPEPAKAADPAPAVVKGKPGRPKKTEAAQPEQPAPAPDTGTPPAPAGPGAGKPETAPQTTAAVTLDEARARFAAKAREPGIGLAKVQALIKAAGVDTIASLEPAALAALLAKAEALT